MTRYRVDALIDLKQCSRHFVAINQPVKIHQAYAKMDRTETAAMYE